MRLEDTSFGFGNRPSPIDEPSTDLGKPFVTIIEQSLGFEDKEFVSGCKALGDGDEEFGIDCTTLDIADKEFVVDCKAFDAKDKELVFGCKAFDVGNTSSSIDVSSMRVVEQATRDD
jgi:hypothetical protein